MNLIFARLKKESVGHEKAIAVAEKSSIDNVIVKPEKIYAE